MSERYERLLNMLSVWSPFEEEVEQLFNYVVNKNDMTEEEIKTFLNEKVLSVILGK